MITVLTVRVLLPGQWRVPVLRLTTRGHTTLRVLVRHTQIVVRLDIVHHLGPYLKALRMIQQLRVNELVHNLLQFLQCLMNLLLHVLCLP